jgi:hypothetical protein
MVQRMMHSTHATVTTAFTEVTFEGCHKARAPWAAAGSIDTDLSFLSLLELYRTDITER